MVKRPAARSVHATSISLALIYTRVSGDEQGDEGRSLPAQLAECRRYAAGKGWVIDSEWQDVMSGKRDDRPQYQALLTRMRELRAEHRRVVVVVAWLHRLGRRIKERVNAWEQCKQLDVEIHAAIEGGLQTEVVYNILAAVAQEETRQLGERVSTIWANLADQGWFKVSALLPWGYRSRPATGDERSAGSPMSVIEPDPVAAPYVREVFSRSAAGQSTREIARWTQTLPTEVRGTRRDIVRKAEVHMLKHVLRNPVYSGRNEPGGPLCRWEAIVDDITWHTVQHRIDAHRDAPRRDPEYFVLTGFMRCPSCSRGMAGGTIRIGDKTMRRYRCTGNQRTGALDNRCNETVRSEQVESLVFDAISAIIDPVINSLSSQQALERAWAQLSEPVQSRDNARDVRRLEQQAEQARRRINSATRLFVDGSIEKPAYDGMCAEEQATLRFTEAQLSQLRSDQDQTETVIPPLKHVLASVGQWSVALRSTDAQLQRDALSMLVQRVVPHRIKRGVYDVEITWTPRAEALSLLMAVDTDRSCATTPREHGRSVELRRRRVR